MLKGTRKALFTSFLMAVAFMSVAMVKTVECAVNVYLAAGSPASLQAELIADVTTHYNAQLIASPYFAGTYAITISGKKPVPPCGGQAPCDLDRNLALLVANSTRTYDYGFAAGMDAERWQSQQLFYAMQAQDFANRTCGGEKFKPEEVTIGVYVTSNTAVDQCINAYNVIVSTINQRWGYVFTSTGGIAAK